MLSNLSKMGRRAFTLVELIIVIVIVGILAAISIVGYQSVVERAEERAVETSLESVDREFRALDAFNVANDAEVKVSDMTSFPELKFYDGTPAFNADGDVTSDALTAADMLDAGDSAVWVKDGVTGVLTFNGATQAGTITVPAP